MNKFLIASHTDIGISRPSNQDSLMIQGMASGSDEIVISALCDGMGGMQKGELASATVVRAISNWFQSVYATATESWNVSIITAQWKNIFETCNQKLQEYGKKNDIQLGTTASVILIHSDGRYVIGHVGDTRIYKISNDLKLLTEDHTLVAREVRNGKLTAAQALTDPRRNVLLQCIGVNNYLEPQFVSGKLELNEGILMCSDGFRHEITDDEIFYSLTPRNCTTTEQTKCNLKKMVELNKQRGEKDNITVSYIKRL